MGLLPKTALRPITGSTCAGTMHGALFDIANRRPCVEHASDFLPERTIPGFYVVCVQAMEEHEGDLVTHRLQAFSHVDSLKKPQIERQLTTQVSAGCGIDSDSVHPCVSVRSRWRGWVVSSGVTRVAMRL